MGCGSSSLKGEAPDGLAGAAPQPIRKTNTNFSTINYEQDNINKKRRMTEYAPEDVIRNKSETSAPPDAARTSRPSTRGDEGPGGERVELEPYTTLDNKPGSSGLADQSYPHQNLNAGSSSRPGDASAVTNGDGIGGPDPTSSTAKDQFAATNDPAHKSGLAPNEEPKERRRSWIDKLKGGERKEISDEDMKKYTGMNKEQMKQYAEKGPGVGGRQPAANVAGLGMGAGVA